MKILSSVFRTHRLRCGLPSDIDEIVSLEDPEVQGGDESKAQLLVHLRRNRLPASVPIRLSSGSVKNRSMAELGKAGEFGEAGLFGEQWKVVFVKAEQMTRGIKIQPLLGKEGLHFVESARGLALAKIVSQPL